MLFEDSQDKQTGEQPNGFLDRRRERSRLSSDQSERRQFGNTHFGLSPDALELAQAIDEYKMKSRRRFINCEEMLQVIRDLGYAKTEVVQQSESIQSVSAV